MGLKQSVVIVNEFTTKTSGGGTRGGTPGGYVTRYMARSDASEGLAPVKRDDESIKERYAMREMIADTAGSVPQLKNDLRTTQGDNGVAFGYGEYTLSHRRLKEIAKEIQTQFDKGKTVMKTVISFDAAYLKAHGIISDDFELYSRGDYKGNVDQLKLRMAIMNGMDRLADSYEDLRYVGVIQVDTDHVHCHLAVYDAGEGKLMPDGTQKGKITSKQRDMLRLGIDSYLTRSDPVRMMTANTKSDKRNTLCFIKKYAHLNMNKNGMSQFLMACLPENRDLWRADNGLPEMKKANAIVREYVIDILRQPDSGYDRALQRLDEGIRFRMSDNFSAERYARMYKAGQESIVTAGMNGIYSMMKEVPRSEFKIRTPMLETMALPYEQMANEAASDPMIEFGFRLRSYKSRLDHHRNERNKYRDAVSDYEDRRERGETDETSLPLLLFLQEEEQYNDKLFAKYQHFLAFIPSDIDYKSDLAELRSLSREIYNMSLMSDDIYIKSSVDPFDAEEYGVSVYGLKGAGLIADGNAELFAKRISDMRDEYDQKYNAMTERLADHGLALTKDEKIVHKIDHAFDDVKALDLHHMAYDFAYDARISRRNVDAFLDAANARYDAFLKARDYLERSGQSNTVDVFDVKDIEAQHKLAEHFIREIAPEQEPVLDTQRTASSEQRAATHTINIGYEYYGNNRDDMQNIVKNVVNDLQYE